MNTSSHRPSPPVPLIWHEEGGFLHGYLNGGYYRMVCSAQEFAELRGEKQQHHREPLDDNDLWWTLCFVCPAHIDFGPFEPVSPFEEDQSVEKRRRIIATNLYLDPQTTTWYGLKKAYDSLIRIRRPRVRRNVLRQRLLDLGLNPKEEHLRSTRQLRSLALDLGFNPFTATWQDIEAANHEVHKLILPKSLVGRVRARGSLHSLSFEQVVQQALEDYLARSDPGPGKSRKGRRREKA